MINYDNLFNQVNAIYEQMTNRAIFDNRVPVLDEHKNLAFVDANDPRAKNAVNQLDYITSKFKEFAAPFKKRPYAAERPIISLRAADRDSLMNKLILIRQTSLEFARDQQSYKQMAIGYFGSYLKTAFDPILKAKNDMTKALQRIDECVVFDPKIELRDQFSAVVATLRQAAAAASESIYETVNGYRDHDKTVAVANSSLMNVNTALTRLRSAITKAGRDIEDILTNCSKKETKACLEDPQFKAELRDSLNGLHETFASISDSLTPPREMFDNVMSRLYFTPDSEGASPGRVNASPEEKTYNMKLSQLNSLVGFVHKIKDQKNTPPVTLLLTLDQIRTLIIDLEKLEKVYPSLIRQNINKVNDEIGQHLESVNQEKRKVPVNEDAIARLRSQIKECEETVKERMAALEGIRALIHQPIVEKAKGLLAEMKDSPLLKSFGDQYERPLTIDLDFWLFEGLHIDSNDEIKIVDQALLDHDRAMDGMSSCMKNPLKALRELDEAIFGIASLPPIDKKPKG